MPTSRHPPRARAAALRAVVSTLLGAFCLQSVGAGSLAEYGIKAAFMYNFAKFVQWPPAAFARPQSPLILCVIGQDPFGAALATIEHKIAQGRELLVRRQARLEDARACHILYVAESERRRLAAILHAVSGASVLTVSDMDRFAESGGIIGLYDQDNNVQFSVNLEEANGALLNINSQLLKLAKIVRRDARDGTP